MEMKVMKMSIGMLRMAMLEIGMGLEMGMRMMERG